MKRKVTILELLGVWLAVSLVTGAFLNQVKWGDPSGFHGTGLPIPLVVWDKHPETGELVDYIANPLVMALNPLLVFLAGAVLILSVWAVGKALCWLKLRSSSRTLPP